MFFFLPNHYVGITYFNKTRLILQRSTPAHRGFVLIKSAALRVRVLTPALKIQFIFSMLRYWLL